MSDLISLCLELTRRAGDANHRAVLQLQGDMRWCREQGQRIAGFFEQHLWLGTPGAGAPADAVSAAAAQRHLGSGCDCLIVDLWAGFNPNAFGQLSGTLRGGGLLVLLLPQSWPDFDDPELAAIAVEPYAPADVGRRFLKRLASQLDTSGFSRWQQGEALPALPPQHESLSSQVLPAKGRTADQQRAVTAILKAVKRGRRPLVITADRGRGKSAALGMAAAELVQQGKQVVVTAPNRSAVDELFRFAGDHSVPGRTIPFLEPDQALAVASEGMILLVDEAAAIPAPMLLRLLQHFSRVIFSSTVHGYEGTGRGFAVRFMPQLDRLAPGWQQISMKQPVRWGEHDPLEAFVFDALLLDAEVDDLDALDANAETELLRIDRDRLAADESRLRQVFGLLVQAHYRTTPGDLRILLDSPNLHIWLALSHQQVVGVLLVAEEGPVDPALAEAIWQGKRRPTGHLLPQTLIAQEGCLQAATYKAGRIMRIAVHPQQRRHGLGSRLLRTLKRDAQGLGWDYLGSSFAASPDLLPFWLQNGFQMVRLGQGRDLVSGCHAALVTQGITDSYSALQAELQQRFQQQLPLLLGRIYRDLEPELLLQLIDTPDPCWQLNAQDKRDLQAFACHNRMLESCLVPLQKLLLQFAALNKAVHLSEQQRWLIQLILQQQALETAVPGQGRKAVMRQLRGAVGAILADF